MVRQDLTGQTRKWKVNVRNLCCDKLKLFESAKHQIVVMCDAREAKFDLCGVISWRDCRDIIHDAVRRDAMDPL